MTLKTVSLSHKKGGGYRYTKDHKSLYRASDGTYLEDWSLIVGIQTGPGVEDKEILQGPGGRIEGGALHVRLRLMEQVPYQGGSGLWAQPEIQNKCGKLADPNLLLSW